MSVRRPDIEVSEDDANFFLGDKKSLEEEVYPEKPDYPTSTTRRRGRRTTTSVTTTSPESLRRRRSSSTSMTT